MICSLAYDLAEAVDGWSSAHPDRSLFVGGATTHVVGAEFGRQALGRRRPYFSLDYAWRVRGYVPLPPSTSPTSWRFTWIMFTEIVVFHTHTSQTRCPRRAPSLVSSPCNEFYAIILGGLPSGPLAALCRVVGSHRHAARVPPVEEPGARDGRRNLHPTVLLQHVHHKAGRFRCAR